MWKADWKGKWLGFLRYWKGWKRVSTRRLMCARAGARTINTLNYRSNPSILIFDVSQCLNKRRKSAKNDQ